MLKKETYDQKYRKFCKHENHNERCLGYLHPYQSQYNGVNTCDLGQFCNIKECTNFHAIIHIRRECNRQDHTDRCLTFMHTVEQYEEMVKENKISNIRTMDICECGIRCEDFDNCKKMHIYQ